MEMSRFSTVIKQYVHMPIQLFGCLVNLFTLRVLLRKQLRSKTTCVYLATIATCDAVVLFEQFVYIANQVHLWSAQKWSCRMIQFTFYFTLHSSVLVLVAMTTEKYVSVRFPLKASLWISRKRTGLVIVLLLIVSFLVNGHNLIFRDVGISFYDNVTVSCDYKFVDKTTTYYFFVTQVYTWIDSVLYCFAPFLIVATLNAMIVITLLREAKIKRSLSQNREHATSQEAQITRVLLALTTMFLLMTGPLAVLLTVRRIAPSDTVSKVFRYFTVLQYLYHSLNTLISMCCSAQFRTHMKATVCCATVEQERSASASKSVSNRQSEAMDNVV